MMVDDEVSLFPRRKAGQAAERKAKKGEGNRWPEEEEQEESLFKADAVNEEDSERGGARDSQNLRSPRKWVAHEACGWARTCLWLGRAGV